MLGTIAIAMLLLWMLGFVTSYTLGGFVHVLLVVGLALFVLQMFNDRKTGGHPK